MQQDELRKLKKKTNEVNWGKVKAKKPNNKFNNRNKTFITSDVNNWVTKWMTDLDQEKDHGKYVEAYIMSIIQKASWIYKASISGATD